MDQTKVARKYLFCQKLINVNGHEARIAYVGRNEFVKFLFQHLIALLAMGIKGQIK